ncbi:hypothetical protein GUJ93_ZPchr0010g9709 [Zizania palustris]|uniref:Uncharacterized protein n=1 Tax=Zizania palustris TaxID=103762 RepID=A0A8J5W8G8_ZIZPA|nr:hypothetical protein GUJ93_ZPchr0010g9709 [Zizania palustris]
MADSDGDEAARAPAPPVHPHHHRRPPRPRGGGGGSDLAEGFVAALRRRVSFGAATAARASFSADSGDESASGEPSSSHRRGDSNGEASSAGGGAGDFSAFTFRAAAPVHRKAKESPLSSDAIFKQSHAGLFNLCIVVLVAVNSRLIIENLMKVLS